MEKNRLLRPAIRIIASMIFGALITLVVIHFTGTQFLILKPCPSTLTQTQVSSYMTSYQGTAASYQGILSGFNVDLMQYNAMTCLLTHNSQLAGFRIYNGKDNTGANITMLVGVDNAGKDDRTLFYQVVPVNSGPCPPICDVLKY